MPFYQTDAKFPNPFDFSPIVSGEEGEGIGSDAAQTPFSKDKKMASLIDIADTPTSMNVINFSAFKEVISSFNIRILVPKIQI
jgi:hypothetical protein